MSPLISIVIPCFNAEKTIREAVESALAQTWTPKEVIVIDDGSTDGSLKIVQSFGDAVRWESGPNRGGGAARNLGVRIARGEFIQFLDADDLLDPEKIRKQYNFANSHHVDLTFCDGIALQERSDRLLHQFNTAYHEEDPLIYILRHQIPTPSPLHRKEIFLSVGGFREDLPCSQERDLMIRLAAAGKSFAHLPETLYTQRRFPNSVSSDYTKVLFQFAPILQPVYNRLKAENNLTDERARAFAEMLVRAARHLIQLNEKDKALEYFSLARKMHWNGGLTAYGKIYRITYRLFGPGVAERLAGIRRRISTGTD